MSMAILATNLALTEALPFYIGIAMRNVGEVQRAAGEMKAITSTIGEALLPTVEAAACRHIEGSDTFLHDLLRLRNTPTTLSADPLKTLASRFSAKHLGYIKARIMSTTRDNVSNLFPNSNPETVQQLSAFFLYRQEKRRGIFSRLHAGVSIFIAGGIATAALARGLLEPQTRTHYKALVQAGSVLDFGQYIDLCWLNDFLHPIGAGAMIYLLCLLSKQHRQITTAAVRMFSLTALALSLRLEGNQFVGREGVFDPVDLAVPLASFLLACRLAPLAWLPKRW